MKKMTSVFLGKPVGPPIIKVPEVSETVLMESLQHSADGTGGVESGRCTAGFYLVSGDMNGASWIKAIGSASLWTIKELIIMDKILWDCPDCKNPEDIVRKY